MYSPNLKPNRKFFLKNIFYKENRKPQPQPQGTQSQNEGEKKDFTMESAANVVLGDKFNQTVDEICKMGFPKEDAVRALKAAFNNPDRAIEYLINGIPEIPAEHHHQPNPLAGASNNQGSLPHPQPHVHQPEGGSLGGAGSSNPFMQLLNNPQLQMVRTLIRQQPQMLPAILMQLQQSNPELFNVIT